MTYGKEVYVTYNTNLITNEITIDQVFELKEDAQWFCDQQNHREKELRRLICKWFFTPKTFFTKEVMNRGN